MSLSTRVLVALIAGLAAGLALNLSQSPITPGVVAVVQPVGTLFINAIRMTVIPLIVSLIVVGIASSARHASLGRLSAWSLLFFAALLTLSGVWGALIARPAFAHAAPAASAAASFGGVVAVHAPAASGAGGGTSFGTWLTQLVPPNVITAAAQGAMLPLIIFSAFLGAALLAVPAERRDAFLAPLRGVAEAMLVLVRWILQTAPIGVFALALPLAAQLGLSAIGPMVTYVVVVSAATASFAILVVYPTAVVLGRVSPTAFARAVAPAQVVAFSSRSSLAALPALIEGARNRLQAPDVVSSFVLPLASAVFRIGAPVGLTVGTLFLASLSGVSLTTVQVATVVVTAVLTSFSIPGVPGGSIIAMAPVLAGAGVPAAGLGLLLALDTIPDTVRTTANVTGQMAAAAVMARRAT